MNESLLKVKDKNIEKIYLNIFNSIKLKKYDFKNAASILEIPIPEIENNYEKLAKLVMNILKKLLIKVM